MPILTFSTSSIMPWTWSPVSTEFGFYDDSNFLDIKRIFHKLWNKVPFNNIMVKSKNTKTLHLGPQWLEHDGIDLLQIPEYLENIFMITKFVSRWLLGSVHILWHTQVCLKKLSLPRRQFLMEIWNKIEFMKFSKTYFCIFPVSCKYILMFRRISLF